MPRPTPAGPAHAAAATITPDQPQPAPQIQDSNQIRQRCDTIQKSTLQNFSNFPNEM